MPKYRSPEKKPLLIEMDLPVRSYDIDQFRHVNNQVYIRWLEDMRHRFLDVHLPFKELLDSGRAPIITSTEIHYRQGIHLFDKPMGLMWVSGLSKAIFTLGAEFVVNGEVTTWAKQCGVFADTETMKILRVPDSLREGFQSVMDG